MIGHPQRFGLLLLKSSINFHGESMGFTSVAVKQCFALAGFDIINSATRWGADVWSDIRKIVLPSSVRTVFDVGANIGQTSLKATKFFPKAEIFAFEPVASTWEQLRQNTTQYPRVHPIHAALGSLSGTATIYTRSDSRVATLSSSGLHHEKWLRGESQGTEDVPVLTASQFANEHNIRQIDLLKIDTEGFDCEVLKGSIPLFEKGAVRLIYTEFNTIASANGGRGDLVDAINILRPFDFKLIATYTDSVKPTRGFYGTHNALFVADPPRGERR